jgi:hypothetical protein
MNRTFSSIEKIGSGTTFVLVHDRLIMQEILQVDILGTPELLQIPVDILFPVVGDDVG